ncbi:MAG: hypothetical protein Q9226_007016 [Calogaya cf. arnoldii]
MRLLRTKTLEFGDFLDSQLPRYAILSHRWGEKEVSFKEMRRFQKDTLDASEDDRYDVAQSSGPGMAKIKNFCQKAARNGFDWCWIDTCCIDKRSSAELSESINAMYKWYARSTVCYIYLADLEISEHEQHLRTEQGVRAWSTRFRGSEWFTRGWTLQELLAPNSSQVSFFDTNWTYIGHLSDLLDDVAATTGISKVFLVEGGLQDQGEQGEISVARVMSWTSRRITSRGEDIAYCLLGLFDVNIPLLYGEGAEKAFHRLQIEVMKQKDDESLFAWTGNGTEVGALASSPACFANSGNILKFQRTINRLPYSVTNKGLEFSIPRPHLQETGKTGVYQFGIHLNCFRRPGGDRVFKNRGDDADTQHPIALHILSYVEGDRCLAARISCDTLDSSQDLTLGDLHLELLHGDIRRIYLMV